MRECEFCHLEDESVKVRHASWDEEADGRELCIDCWRDVQEARRLGMGR